MRVTHVITRLIVGGAQENTIASVLGLAKIAGVEASLISGVETGPEGSLAGEFKASPEKLLYLPELVRSIHPWKDVIAYKKLIRLFRAQKPDLVHTHSGKAGFLGRLAARQAGVRTIIHTIHGPSFGRFQGAFANQLLRAAERRAGKITTQFVVVAEAMKQQYLAAGIGTERQYTKIFSGFPLAPFLTAKNDPALRTRYHIGPEDVVVGTIARLFKLKGHDDLFRVAPELVRRCPRIKFLWVGDGPWRERFEQRAASLGLAGHFIFTGLVAPQEVSNLISIMDLVAHLSLREGLARALPQALAVGRPIIAYDCDGAGEVCRHNETGFLLRAGDLGGLREAVALLAGNPGLRDQLGRNGRELVRENFAEEKMIRDLFALYLKLLPDGKLTLS